MPLTMVQDDATCMGCMIICKHLGLFSKYDKEEKSLTLNPSRFF